MLKELLARFRKPKEPVVDERALAEEKRQKRWQASIENYYKERAQRLEDICKHLQLSREGLKEKLDITEEMIVDFESVPSNNFSDFQESTAMVLYKLIKHANVNPVYLIGGAGEMFLREEDALKITSLDFGEYNEEVISLITFMLVSGLFRLHMLEHSNRLFNMDHDFFMLEIARFKSKMEEKNG